MPFPQVPAWGRRILGGRRRSGWLWCCGMSCWWCSGRMTKRSSPAGSVRGRRGQVREGYEVVALLLKPNLGLFRLVGRRRVLLPHPGSATGHLIAPGDHHTLQHIQAHFGVDFQANFEDVRGQDVAFTWNHNHSRKLFSSPWARLCYLRQSRFSFWWCWQWYCCHSLDQLRAWVVQRCISDLARWTLCHFQTW